MPFLECAQSPCVLILKSRDFPVEFQEGDGLKNRRLGQCKMWIRQVLISRTLTGCGEVAEWPKAAVAKAAGDHRTGLKSTISGPFFIGNLVGVGCRMMVIGPRLGTLVGTLR